MQWPCAVLRRDQPAVEREKKVRSNRLARDVIVIGYGGAGAFAAIEAADAGARVLLLEKMEHLGGLTMLCSGYMRVATDAAGAAAYLQATNGGRVNRRLAEALAQGMTEVPAYLESLARRVNAVMHLSLGKNQEPYETSDLYDWQGREALGWAGIQEVPGFNGYPWVHAASRGQHLMRTLEANVNARDLEVWFSSPARRLIVEAGEVVGVMVERDGKPVQVHANGGVILACGGFEFNHQMLQDFMELPIVYPMGHPGNTGDGIQLAQQAGAALWHMWHIHGSYGVKFPEFPVAFRTPLGGARRNERALAWILMEQHGRRFMNEEHPAPQDTGSRPFEQFNPESGVFDRIPAWMVFDEPARCMGPIARPVSAVPEHRYEWSRDNSKEIARGWILSAPTLEALAKQANLPQKNFLETVERWNDAVRLSWDNDFGRPPGTMVPLATPPFYAAQVFPVCSNTQGGPKHDEFQRVLDAFDQPIPGLYAIGELGSFFGHIYMLGGNLTEGLVGGRIAGRRAAQGLDRLNNYGRRNAMRI